MTMNAMANLKFGKRLAVSFGAVTALMLVMAGLAIWGIGAVSESNEAALATQTRA
jgi:CHASE3 domain sensor protein